MPSPNAAAPQFLPLTGLYEPSAIQQLPDGRFLVVEDEVDHPFSLVSFGSDGAVYSHALSPGWFEGNQEFWKLNDLEGLALDAQGWIYAMTSHSRNSAGEEKKARDKLVRFRIEGNKVTATQVLTGVKPALTATHPVLAAAALISDVKGAGGLNVEALEITPDRAQLMIGLRSPLQDGRAIIARLDNPVGVFEAGEPARIAPRLDTLDLGGHGLRGLSYVPALGGYVLISGPVAREATPFGLWFWPGGPEDAARPIRVPGLAGFERAEGVSPALLDGRPQLILVSDDGSRDDGRFGRYLRLDLDQLQIGA
jgi:hypothetical protein